MEQAERGPGRQTNLRLSWRQEEPSPPQTPQWSNTFLLLSLRSQPTLWHSPARHTDREPLEQTTSTGGSKEVPTERSEKTFFCFISFSSILPISESDLSPGKAGGSLVETSEGFVIHIFYTNFYYIKAFFIKAFQCKHQA